MALHAYSLETGKLVNPGDELIDFRGEVARFMKAVDPTVPGRSGKVEVATWSGPGGRRILYANVFGLVVREETP